MFPDKSITIGIKQDSYFGIPDGGFQTSKVVLLNILQYIINPN